MPLIFDIKRFAINDGPGIRTTLFMKGCPLRCAWCHNPEGISAAPTKLYTRKKCIGCQSCVGACPQHNLQLTSGGIADLGHCTLCGKCADECPSLALQLAGREWGMEELMQVVEKERKVMEDSQGGVTICGGEPLMHPDYLAALLGELRSRRFHCAVDTTLYATAATVERILPLADLLLVDLKMMDTAKHRRFTQVGNEQIIGNIRLIASRGANYWIRIPLIVGVNADDGNLRASAGFLASLPKPPEVVNILPYHDIGKGKHSRMGTDYNPNAYRMDAPSEELQQHAVEIFVSQGLNVRVGG